MAEKPRAEFPDVPEPHHYGRVARGGISDVSEALMYDDICGLWGVAWVQTLSAHSLSRTRVRVTQ